MPDAASTEPWAAWLDMAQTADTADFLEARQVAVSLVEGCAEKLAAKLGSGEAAMRRQEWDVLVEVLVGVVLRNLKTNCLEVGR